MSYNAQTARPVDIKQTIQTTKWATVSPLGATRL